MTTKSIKIPGLNTIGTISLGISNGFMKLRELSAVRSPTGTPMSIVNTTRTRISPIDT